MKLARIILLLLSVTILLVIVFSCSDAKIASRSYEKAVKHGYECKQIEKKVEVLVKGKDGKNSIIYLPCICPEIELPKSNVEIRQDARNERRENKHDFKLELKKMAYDLKLVKEQNDSLKQALKYDVKNNRIDSRQESKQVKHENKKSYWWIWYLLGILTVAVVWFALFLYRMFSKMPLNLIK